MGHIGFTPQFKKKFNCSETTPHLRVTIQTRMTDYGDY